MWVIEKICGYSLHNKVGSLSTNKCGYLICITTNLECNKLVILNILATPFNLNHYNLSNH